MKIMMDRVDNKESVKRHYCQKHMATKTEVSAYNAMTIRMVFNTLIKEGMRRMRNKSPSLLPDEKKEQLRTFNLWMAKNHHSEDFRIQITRTVMRKYNALTNLKEEGGMQL